MTAPTLRTASDADVEALIDFWLEAGENDGRPADHPAAVRRQLVRDPDALVVAELDGRIVGTVIAGWDGWRAHLYRLAVHPDHRRRGIGRLLMEHAERRFVEIGGKRADAMVLDENEVGRAVWETAGYVRQDEWSRWVKPLPTTP